jgi:predicted PurR-regulated permease PerM
MTNFVNISSLIIVVIILILIIFILSFFMREKGKAYEYISKFDIQQYFPSYISKDADQSIVNEQNNALAVWLV